MPLLDFWSPINSIKKKKDISMIDKHNLHNLCPDDITPTSKETIPDEQIKCEENKETETHIKRNQNVQNESSLMQDLLTNT